MPKTYIQSVETGVRDYLKTGPLGFPVVDVAVNLSDGSYHAVDSSDMAFQMAAKLAMKEGMAACSPVLLEPVMKVEIVTPSEATSKIIALIPQRRGQILGYDARPDWPGWDVVEATMPQAEIGDLIIELRSATAGVASYRCGFDHMAELDRTPGRRGDERQRQGCLTGGFRPPARKNGARMIRTPLYLRTVFWEVNGRSAACIRRALRLAEELVRTR